MNLIPDFLISLHKEIEIRKDYLEGEQIETIYLGGGTPSLLKTGQISSIFDSLYRSFSIAKDCEITLETNPDDLSYEFLTDLHKVGVNRLSIGTQSFNDSDLKVLNRRHNARQSSDSIEFARKAGFNNLSVDLIYGIPGMSIEVWKRNLEIACQAEHISAYHLTIEPGTALSKKIAKGLLALTDESDSEIQFNMIDEICIPTGFEHYEISNLAKKGYTSRHNSNYWIQKKYLGIGPSAHSFNTVSRQWNHADLKKYIKALETGLFENEIEILSPTNRYNEFVMLSLRTSKGINEQEISNLFGGLYNTHFIKTVEPYLNSKHIIRTGSSYVMTRKGWMISDYILGELMFEE